MVDPGVLVGVVDAHGAPHEVAVHHLDVVLGEALALPLLDELQDRLNVLLQVVLTTLRMRKTLVRLELKWKR